MNADVVVKCTHFSKLVFFLHLHNASVPVSFSMSNRTRNVPIIPSAERRESRVCVCCWNMIMVMTLPCEAFNDYTHTPHFYIKTSRGENCMGDGTHGGQNTIGMFNPTAELHLHPNGLQTHTSAAKDACVSSKQSAENRNDKCDAEGPRPWILEPQVLMISPFSPAFVVMKEHLRQRVT